MSENTNPDGKFVVVQDGQRVSGQLHENQAAAAAEAESLRAKHPINETSNPKGKGDPKPVKIVQNLLG